MARPTDYTPEIAKHICQQLAEGRSLRSICEGEDMPNRSTVYDWLDANVQGFPDQYARARTRQAETFLDEIIEIADDTSNDDTQTEHGPIPNHEWITRSKVRIDSRKWFMAKVA
ncbi:MAG: terminase small subunit protein, partial [Hymenobacter sp.]